MPSTRTPGKPKPLARRYSGVRLWRSSGSEMAHWLFWQKKTTGALVTDAQMKASLTSPWLVAPSPKYAMARLAVLAHRAVALDAHRVAGGVQRLAADDDRVQVEVVRGRVPAAVADAAEQLKQLHRVQAAAPGHAVLPVGREGHVARPERAAGADLRGLLAEQRRPDPELALALERDRLEVDPADDDQVPVQGLDLLGGDLQRVVGVLDSLPFGGEELDQLEPSPPVVLARGLQPVCLLPAELGGRRVRHL